MVKEEGADFFVESREHPACSPYNCFDAANIIINLLATKQQEKNG
jgi:hypothetical protein